MSQDTDSGETQQHPGVPERVRLDAIKIQKLGHAFVVGTKEFDIDLGRHDAALEHFEAMPLEEVHFEGQAKHSRDS
jgi:hypothetical protein